MKAGLSPEMETLKSKLRSTWEAGDFAEVATHVASTAEAFVNRLDMKPGMKVLDVACGSGNLAIPAAAAGADVTGIDIAANLVEAAKRRAAEAGVNAKFEHGDAEALPYEDNTFDLVMTMFGAMFAPRPDVVASELLRVCKPGGRIAMANWTPEGFAGQMFKLSTKYIPPPDMPAPVQWGVPEIVQQRFGDGVSDLKTEKRLADMVFEFGPEEVAEFFKTYFGPTVMALKAMGEENHAAYTKDLSDTWAANNTANDGTTHVKGEFLEVIATKA